MAYKSRVPVRGAILLNEAMDEVVLVKGWKKSANWSFPRGKINKDEHDLDCAVREVYEETGYDVRAAGLVKEEKDMKYIEVTMREQHMRLYVFRGVSRDAHFEPKTRKEISKIEWYKLTDLPTLKKNRQHEGSGTDHAPINANKFYMVAPFLNPLKKWITQQRKKENRYSSQLAAPPMVAEDVMTEEEQDLNGTETRLAETAPPDVSDLPEVSAPAFVDPSSHLKKMLRIGAPSVQSEVAEPPNHMLQVDSEKSNALLALLRGKPQVQAGHVPQSPQEQVRMPPEPQQSPHVSHVREPQINRSQPPPPLQRAREIPALPITHPSVQRPQAPSISPEATSYSNQAVPQLAPYQRIGDPLSRPQGALQTQHAGIPPASALPKLTKQAKALLDVFKGSKGLASLSLPVVGAARPTDVAEFDPSPKAEAQRSNLPSDVGLASQAPQGGNRGLNSISEAARLPRLQDTGLESQFSSLLSSRRPQSAQKTSLLELFSQPLTTKTPPYTGQPSKPVELAATAAHTPNQKAQAKKDDLTLLRQGHGGASRKAPEAERPYPREGETAATIHGPLNQPDFEVISRPTKHTTSEMGRSPLTTNRTLYDPNAPAPVKILTRPEDFRPQPPRSPRGMKPPLKRTVREKAPTKEQVKPFQPQILRRPQTAEGVAVSSRLQLPSDAVTQETAPTAAVPLPSVLVADTVEKAIPSRKASQAVTQKQMLLSLFGPGLDTTSRVTAPQPNTGTVSPLTTSQSMSASAEIPPFSGVDPISTRTSQGGSLASIVSGPGAGRIVSEKRQTGAENKAFLLGYLGRIASEEK